MVLDKNKSDESSNMDQRRASETSESSANHHDDSIMNDDRRTKKSPEERDENQQNLDIISTLSSDRISTINQVKEKIIHNITDGCDVQPVCCPHICYRDTQTQVQRTDSVKSQIKPCVHHVTSSKPSRKGSTVNWGPIYTVPVFSRNYNQFSEESNNIDSSGEEGYYHHPHQEHPPTMPQKRRSVTSIDSCGGDGDGDDRKNSSVGNILFGNPSYGRRFSQDLWNLKLAEEEAEEIESETTKVIFFQVFIPFLIAGFGNVGAGLILDYVQNWPVFQNVSGLFVLVASFLGFKGNLEMTLAARLSTQANLGKMDLFREQIQIASGNIALIQCQAIVVAFLAALIAIGSASVKALTFDIEKSIILLATSLVTASATGLLLATVMVIVVIVSRKANVNPDNVSTLIAAFLGDITAVIVIAGSSVFFYRYQSYWISGCVIFTFIAVLPLFSWIARKNKYTHEVIGTGWLPIILAMIISSQGGFIFDYAVDQFRSIALFQPIINGVGSNLVAVQASRISTYFHQRADLGELPETSDGKKVRVCEMPHKAFFGPNPNAKTARLLLLMVIPGHIIYIVALKLLMPKFIWITGPFLTSYGVVAIVQVAILLYIAHVTVPMLWKMKFDPDNNAIPCLMSLGDLTGTAFFTLAYVILALMGDPNARLT
ncbi:solute carrier family 41 member 1-like [Brevipalpus obovatus]|uniref:solute carrier family 41 member 1-like n=1 Tax=Brevipalpus obovatus TaxID=246614 RepID=UPI003D9F38A0